MYPSAQVSFPLATRSASGRARRVAFAMMSHGGDAISGGLAAGHKRHSMSKSCSANHCLHSKRYLLEKDWAEHIGVNTNAKAWLAFRQTVEGSQTPCTSQLLSSLSPEK